MKIGIIREGKVPADSRVPLTPSQIAALDARDDLDFVVAPSPNRCYSDEEYIKEEVSMSKDLSDCDVLMGVKEVPIDDLIPRKTYFFFSHTTKKQAYNQKLLQAVIDKEIRLLDYEVLCNEHGARVIAFGKFAGMVGAHNALWTYGERTGHFKLSRMKDCFNYKEAVEEYNKTTFPAIKIVVTGDGRVGSGAAKVLEDMGIRRVDKKAFLNDSFNEVIFTQVDSEDYIFSIHGNAFVKEEFYANPQNYDCNFKPFFETADVLINGIYWDNKAPAFFSLEDCKDPKFNLQVIADVTCDIAPVSSIPTTLFASTIAEPVFGFDPKTGEQCSPYQAECIDMMTIDNLPNEMPRDASEAFGQMFIDHVLEELLDENSQMIEKATVAADGKLGKHFEYLSDYVTSKVSS